MGLFYFTVNAKICKYSPLKREYIESIQIAQATRPIEGTKQRLMNVSLLLTHLPFFPHKKSRRRSPSALLLTIKPIISRF